jgi:hypothetical protein
MRDDGRKDERRGTKDDGRVTQEEIPKEGKTMDEGRRTKKINSVRGLEVYKLVNIKCITI